MLSVENIFLIIAIIVVCFIVFIFLLPRLMKLRMLFAKAKETKNIRNDLMVWKRIAFLARGGKDSDKIKKQMSVDEIGLIVKAFEACKQNLKANFRKSSDLPWFIMLGEPSSGKSSLIDRSNQDMFATENDYVSKNGSRQAAPIRFWINNNAVVADVSGRIFFDSWFEGSNAQWRAIINNLRNKHKNFPLSGIVITVPVDSLIADDEALIKKKAYLIRNEVNRLLNGLGMSLPCYFVVTKIDVISGFREYFSNVDEEIKDAELGWKNSNHIYNEAEFDEFWKEFISKLRLGRNNLMLSSNNFKQEEDRFDKTSKIYMFPENINETSNNLELYLKIIFDQKKMYSFNSNLMLEGVYFTSAKDEGYSLSKHFAKLHNKSIDDAPMAESLMERQGFFISNLFKYQIFYCFKLAHFTQREIFKRSIPHFMVLGFMVIVSVMWLMAVVFNRDAINENIKTSQQYYSEISTLFVSKNIDNAYLIGMDENKNTEYYGKESMPNDPLLSREGFYITALRDAQADWDAPFGFKTSSFLRFGTLNMLHDERLVLFDNIRDRMMTIPLIKSLENHLVIYKDESFTKEKRVALVSLLNFAKVAEENFYYANENYQHLENILRFLLPDLRPEIISILASKETHSSTQNNNLIDTVVLSPLYTNSIKIGVDSMFNAWVSGNIYPDSFFNKLRDMAYSGAKIDSIINELNAFSPLDFNQSNFQEMITYWNNLYYKEKENYNTLESSFAVVKDNLAKIDKFKQDNKVNMNKSNYILLSNIAYEDFLKIHKDDFNLLEFYDNLKPENGKHDIVGDLINNVYLEQNKKDSLLKIEDNYSALREFNFGKLITIFKNVELDKNKDILPLYTLLNELFDLAYNPSKINEKNNNSILAFQNYQQDAIKRLEKLKEYEQKYKNDQLISKIISVLTLMYQQTFKDAQVNFAQTIFSSYPKTQLEIMNRVAQDNVDQKVFESSSYLNLVYKAEYSPLVVENYIKPFWNVSNQIFQKNNNKEIDSLRKILNLNNNFHNTYKAMEDYTLAFIKYWEDYADLLSPSFKNYTEFKNFIKELKPYAVNNDLHNVYYTVYKIIDSLPNDTLSKYVLDKKNQALKAIENKINIINPSFSESCGVVLNTWVSLPSNAIEASKIFNSFDANKIKDSFFGVNGLIPWWSKLFKQGQFLMKKESWESAMEDFKQHKDEFLKFPLCADADISNAINHENIMQLQQILLNFVNNNLEQKALEANSTFLSQGDKEIMQWAKSNLNIIDAIYEPIPLEWNLFILDNQTQINLAKNSPYDSAAARFRYVEFQAENSMAENTRFSTISSKDEPIKIGKGSAYLGNFRFLFYIYSNSVEPDSTVEILDKWAILNLYLKKEIIPDQKNDKIFYIPLKITDRLGSDYIYYIGVEFNKEIVEKNKWLNRYDLPNF